jgi:hypothetical protein
MTMNDNDGALAVMIIGQWVTAGHSGDDQGMNAS